MTNEDTIKTLAAQLRRASYQSDDHGRVMHEFETGARAGLTHFVTRLTTIEKAARALADLIDDEDTGLTEARDTLLAVL